MTLDKPPNQERSPLEIVPATLENVQEIIALHNKVYRDTYHKFTPIHTPAEDFAHFSEVVKTQEVHVAKNGEKIVGYIAFTSGEVSKLYLDPDVQRQGLGKKLLDIAKAENDSLSLWTYEANKKALKFYDAQGFVVAEQTDGKANEEKKPDVKLEWRRDEQSKE